MKNVTRFLVGTALAAIVSGIFMVLAPQTIALTAKDGKPLTEGQKSENKSGDGRVIVSREGDMTVETMRDILKRLDKNVQEPRPGNFALVVNDFEVLVFTAPGANRMRVMVRVRSAENLTKDDLLRMAQANLDSALDARYAVGRGVLWATYVHPLSNLYPLQFIEAIGSTVNLASTYGTTYSSGQVLFGGGDSRGIIGRQLIDKLIEKGRPI